MLYKRNTGVENFSLQLEKNFTHTKRFVSNK